MPDYISLSNVFIDDILFWDDRMFLNVLGGAGVHAMAGARVWSDRIGLLASVGKDFQQEHLEILNELNFDLSMLKVLQDKTTRAWQIFQPDERRVEIFRDEKIKVSQLNLTLFDLPEEYKLIKGCHFYFSGSYEESLENIRLLRKLNPSMKIIMEPSIYQVLWAKEKYIKILPEVDLFSPNLLEGEKITGEKDPHRIIDALLSWGARRVSLRMGEKGSILGSETGSYQKIPAIKKTIIDVTGAGNAYLGGLMVGLCEGKSFIESALMGAVSASFTMEQFGVCRFNADMWTERDKRLEEGRMNLELQD
ncbi:MAG: PfkB family carbohydrate kinase [Anaerolineaceae bacterium]|jgi:sugar/nucleoside kinase (ribokinase family)|nr:PfkB family carbohydrate kinase [Anaerolineaceae bacterium]